MSNFTHSICEDCWDKRNPNRPAPLHNQGDLTYRTYRGESTTCYFCEKQHKSGIYIRERPSKELSS